MASFLIADRVRETTTTTGTGTVNLGGAVSGFRTFVAGIGTTNSTFYAIVLGTEWEVGIGTVTSGSPDTLSRTTVLASSNAGALVNFSAGTKEVWCDIPAYALNNFNPKINLIPLSADPASPADGDMWVRNNEYPKIQFLGVAGRIAFQNATAAFSVSVSVPDASAGNNTSIAANTRFVQGEKQFPPMTAGGGTVDAITATYTPAATLTDGDTVYIVASGANTITNPTFNPNSAGAKTIKKNGNQALAVGDIYGSGHIIILSYDSTNDVWELLNPAVINQNTNYQTILQVAGSHPAAKVAGTYIIPFGDPLAIAGTANGTLYPVGLIQLKAADYPTIAGKAPKLRIRAIVSCNDVAPTGNYTIGLYPVTRPGTSGSALQNIYNVGTVVSGSNGATVTTPAADSMNDLVGVDFAFPSDGIYCLAVVTTATVAASSLVHVNSQLQIHYP